MNILKVLIGFTLFGILLSCKENKKKDAISPEVVKSGYYAEAYRPLFHFIQNEIMGE